MGEWGTVAVITRTKDRPLLLERAMRSVLEQTYGDWRMVIVNDGGAPEPVDALAGRFADQFAGRLTVLHNAVSGGMENASNQGIQASESEYIVIHDDDDSWAPNFLMTSLSELEATHALVPSVMGVITDIQAIFERIESGALVIDLVEPYIHRNPAGLVSLFRMAERNRFPPIAFLYRREVLPQVGLYDASLPVIGDWEFNLRFMLRYDILTLPHPLANYHLRPSATGVAGNSTIVGMSTHSLYEQYLRNALLRNDEKRTSTQLGLLVNIAQQFEMLRDAIHRVPGASNANGSAHTMSQE